MNFAIVNLFSDQLVTAISRTLIHSLWQGVLLIVITGLVMTCTSTSPAARRYNLLVTAMAMFALVVAGTFIMEFIKAEVRIQVSANRNIVNAGPVSALTIKDHEAPSSIAEIIRSYLNRYAIFIVWTWLLIVCVRCAQLLSGLRDVYHLRRSVINAGSYWEGRIQRLAGEFGIKRLIGIAESARIHTPMVAGYLKPLILAPIGMLTSLPPDEAEAILLHELAHIRRADYLVNLLQNIVEIVLFFNPAVLWLSALIRAERENCCDDMVVSRSSKVTYLNALVDCKEYNQRSPGYAMAFSGRNSHLKNRVSRIISNRNLPLNSREKSMVAACLIATAIFVTAFANGQKLNTPVIAAQKMSMVQSDTTKPTGGNQFKSDADRENSIIADMIKDGIVSSRDSLSFKIGTDEFVVNYKKQPQDIYQRYRAKYVAGQYRRGDDWIWYYYFDSEKYNAMTGTRTEITSHDTTTGVFRGKLH
jgi:bla regulator protein BlaR1